MSYIIYTDSLSPMEINCRYNQILEGLIVNAYTMYYRYPPPSFTIQILQYPLTSGTRHISSQLLMGGSIPSSFLYTGYTLRRFPPFILLCETHIFCYHFFLMQICTTCLFIRAIYAYRDLNFTFLLHFLLHLVRALRSRPLPLVLTYSFSLVIFIYLLAAWTPHSPNSNLPFRPVMTLPGFT